LLFLPEWWKVVDELAASYSKDSSLAESGAQLAEGFRELLI
jgi:hypothetical protein